MRKRQFRTAKIILTSEALCLKKLRLGLGLSIPCVAKKLDKSETLIRHIEKGRLDIPKGELLDRLLEVYGIKDRKTFYQMASKHKEEVTPRQEFENILPMLKDEQLKVLLSVAKGLIG